MDTLVNSEDPIKMLQNTEFHPALHCLFLRSNNLRALKRMYMFVLVLCKILVSFMQTKHLCVLIQI